jgi:two-component system, NarL family, sensor histidine kinase UhpB
MKDQAKTKQQLIAELVELRRTVAEQEASLAQSQQTVHDRHEIENGLPVLIATAGYDGYYRQVNPAFERILGWSQEESLSRPFIEFIHPDDRGPASAVLAHLRSGNSVSDFVDRTLCKDGSYRWIRWTVIPVPNREIVYGIGEDVTEQKQAGEALRRGHEQLEMHVQERTAELLQANRQLQLEVEQRREAEERLANFQRFVDAATQGFGMADEEGNIVFVNPFMARLYGAQRPEDVIGNHISRYYPPDYIPRRKREILPALRRGEPWQGEQRLVFPDGQLHPTIHTVFPVLDANGDFYRTAVVITDITELRQAEAALRQSYEDLRKSEERYDLVVRGAGVGVWDWDLLTGKVYYSSRWKELLGYDEDEIGEGVEEWASRLHPHEREWIIQAQDDFFAGPDMTASVEYRLRHRNGSYRWIVAHVLVVRDPAGKVIRLVGSHGDITNRKLAEEQVRKEERALRRMVQASDHERRLITYELHDGVAQQVMGAKMLLGSLKTQTAQLPKIAADAYDEGMEALSRAAFELRRVMNWLRTPVLDKFGVADAIDDVAAQLRLLPETPPIEYHQAVAFERLEPTLENSLFRIAQEAMTNACRHSRSEKIQVQLVQDGDQVTLEVRDWGIGFDPQTVARNCFGLDGIRERVRILGGELMIASRPGEGTVIRATFPLNAAADDE